MSATEVSRTAYSPRSVAEPEYSTNGRMTEEDDAWRPSATVTPCIPSPQTKEEEKLASNQKNALSKVLKNMKNLIDIIKANNNIPKNILFCGLPEAGKSALINLLHSSIQGRYESITEPGSAMSGNVGSLTGHIRHFPNMGLSENDVKHFRERYEIPDDCHLPTFIDMPGLEINVDIIKYVLTGAVPANAETMTFMAGNKLEPFMDIRTAVPRRVDRVVFVASLVKDSSSELLRKIVSVVRGDNGRLPCIPHYLVLTHKDQASNPHNEQEELVISNLIDSLLLRGEAKTRVHEVASYNDEDEIDPDRIHAFATNLEKHADGIAILCKLFSRREVIYPPNVPILPVNELTPLLDILKNFLNNVMAWGPHLNQVLIKIRMNWNYVIYMLLLGLVAFLSYHLHGLTKRLKD